MNFFEIPIGDPETNFNTDKPKAMNKKQFSEYRNQVEIMHSVSVSDPKFQDAQDSIMQIAYENTHEKNINPEAVPALYEALTELLEDINNFAVVEKLDSYHPDLGTDFLECIRKARKVLEQANQNK